MISATFVDELESYGREVVSGSPGGGDFPFWQLTLHGHFRRIADRHPCHRPCLRTANLLFVEVTHLGLQNQKRLMHAIKDPSTNFRPALLTAVGTCIHWILIFRFDRTNYN